MLYITLNEPNRRSVLLASLEASLSLCEQLCVLFELLWYDLVSLSYFSDYCDKDLSGRGITVPTRSVVPLFWLLGLPEDTIGLLESFRNQYVHAGRVPAIPLCEKLISVDLYGLLKICQFCKIKLNFELPM